MEKLPLSIIRMPGGTLGELNRVSVAMTNQTPVMSWLDADLVNALLEYHPVSVCRVSRHYEVVSGFRAFHAVSSLLGSEEVIPVRITVDDETDLVRGALFELISHSLLQCPESVEARQRVYRQLSELSATLRKAYNIEIPKKFSARYLKFLLGLKGRHITHSRMRKSELRRILEK